MKKILLSLFLLLSLAASAQLPPFTGSTKINSRYGWLGVYFDAAILPAYSDSALYPNWVPKKAGHIFLDTAGADKGTIYVKYDGAWHPYVTGSGGGSTIDSLNQYLQAGPGIDLTMVNDSTILIAADSQYISSDDSSILLSSANDSTLNLRAVVKEPFSLLDNGVLTEGAWATKIVNTTRPLTIHVNTIIPITQNRTIPDNITLIVEKGGGFNISDPAMKITISGHAILPNSQVFFGAGSIVATKQAFPQGLNPVWFGALPDDGIDDYAAIAKCAAAANVNKLSVRFPAGGFHTSAMIDWPQQSYVTGAGWLTTTVTTMGAINCMRLNSSSTLGSMRLTGADIGLSGLIVNDGNNVLVENMYFERFTLDGLQTLVINNSTIRNYKSQYNGRANLHIIGSLNTDFLQNQSNVDDAFNGTINTRGILIDDSRNCHIRGGIIERGPGQYQIEIINSSYLTIAALEVNNGLTGILVRAGTVTLDHIQWSNPVVRAVEARGTSRVNVISNGGPMVSGANGREMAYLFPGNIVYNGSSTWVPLFFNSFAGGTGGATTGTGTTIVYDSIRSNIKVTTTAGLNSGINIGGSSFTYVTPPGVSVKVNFVVKNIASGQPLALYVEPATGGTRRFIGLLTEGENPWTYTAGALDRYRWSVFSNVSGANSWEMSLFNVFTTNDSSAQTTTGGPKLGAIEPAADTSVRKALVFFDSKQVGDLIAAASLGGGVGGGPYLAIADTTTAFSQFAKLNKSNDYFGSANYTTGTNTAWHNLSTLTTNIERFRIFWNGNNLNLRNENGGTGIERSIIMGTGTKNQITLSNSPSGLVRINNYNTANLIVTALEGGLNGTGGRQYNTRIGGSVSQTSGAAFTGLGIFPAIVTTGSNPNYLFEAGTSSTGTDVSKFRIDTAGNLFIPYATIASASGSDSVLVKNATTGRIELKAQSAFGGAGVTSVNGNTGAVTIDTTYISNFHGKVKSLFSATGPMTYSPVTGVFAMAPAASGTAGYVTNTTQSFSGDKTFLGNIIGSVLTTAGTSLTLKQTGDTFGESGLMMVNRSGSAGGMFYNNGLDLVDMAFKSSTANQFNLRYEHRSSELTDPANTAGEMQLLSSTGTIKNQSFGIASNWFRGKLGLGGITVPQAALHLPASTSGLYGGALKMSPGVLLTTPENGVIEFDGNHYYGTVGTTRYQLDHQAGLYPSPTFTAVSGTSSISADRISYQRQGNEVIMVYSLSITFTGTTGEFYMSMPISSAMTASNDANGTIDGTSLTATLTGLVQANSTSDLIWFQFQNGPASGTGRINGTISYTIK